MNIIHPSPLSEWTVIVRGKQTNGRVHIDYCKNKYIIDAIMHTVIVNMQISKRCMSLRSLAGNPPLEEDTFSVSVYVFSY